MADPVPQDVQDFLNGLRSEADNVRKVALQRQASGHMKDPAIMKEWDVFMLAYRLVNTYEAMQLMMLVKGVSEETMLKTSVGGFAHTIEHWLEENGYVRKN